MGAAGRSSWHDGAVRERASFASRFSACWSWDEPRDHARRPRAAEDVEVVRNHAEPDPALHSTHAAIATPRQSVPVLEDADSAFATGPPAQRPPEPARAWLAATARQGHAAHAVDLSQALVRCGAEAAVGDGEPGRPAEELLVALEGRPPPLPLRPAHPTDRAIGGDLGLRLLALPQLAP